VKIPAEVLRFSRVLEVQIPDEVLEGFGAYIRKFPVQIPDEVPEGSGEDAL
jgi:hypothetical protein